MRVPHAFDNGTDFIGRRRQPLTVETRKRRNTKAFRVKGRLEAGRWGPGLFAGQGRVEATLLREAVLGWVGTTVTFGFLKMTHPVDKA